MKRTIVHCVEADRFKLFSGFEMDRKSSVYKYAHILAHILRVLLLFFTENQSSGLGLTPMFGHGTPQDAQKGSSNQVPLSLIYEAIFRVLALNQPFQPTSIFPVDLSASCCLDIGQHVRLQNTREKVSDPGSFSLLRDLLLLQLE